MAQSKLSVLVLACQKGDGPGCIDIPAPASIFGWLLSSSSVDVSPTFCGTGVLPLEARAKERASRSGIFGILLPGIGRKFGW